MRNHSSNSPVHGQLTYKVQNAVARLIGVVFNAEAQSRREFECQLLHKKKQG